MTRKRAPRKTNISRTERNNQIMAAIGNDWTTCNQMASALDLTAGYAGSLALGLAKAGMLESSTIYDKVTNRTVVCYRKLREKNEGARVVSFDGPAMREKLRQQSIQATKDRNKAIRRHTYIGGSGQII